MCATHAAYRRKTDTDRQTVSKAAISVKASKKLLTPSNISQSGSLHWIITDSSSFSIHLKQGKTEFGLRCHEGVSGMEGGTVFHPEYFLPLFSFGDNRNQGDASLMGGWEYLSAQKLLHKTLLARECLTLNLASLFPQFSLHFDELTFSSASATLL